MNRTETGFAKLTLTLRMLDKRDDGFNDLEALTVFLENIVDTVNLDSPRGEKPKLEIDMTNKKSEAFLASDDNLVLNAIAKFHEIVLKRGDSEYIHDFACHLTKMIPLQAGLGGGSVDAAATLRMLYGIYEHKVTSKELDLIAADLGSDVSACLYSRKCWMRGRGEHISPIETIDLSNTHALVLTPYIKCSTPEVFRHYEKMGRPKDDGVVPPESLRSAVENLHNDLGIAAFDLYPQLRYEKDRLERKYNINLQLAGSGSTLFTLGIPEDIFQLHSIIKSEEDFRLCEVSSLI